MKVLVDMNLSPAWVATLAQGGFDAVHWSKVGPADARDADIMAYARANDYAVLTHDLDFSAILAATNDGKPSVVQIRSELVSPIAIGASVLLALGQLGTDIAAGALITVDPSRTRVRILPLRT